jgi:hypothetical protein
MTSYGDAFRVFQYFNRGADLNEARPLSTLNLACCFALDGQFEPEVAVRRRRWIDISPPLRFVALARAIRRVGMLPADRLSDLAPDQYARYRDKLCHAAGLEVSLARAYRPRVYDEEISPIDDLRQLSDQAAQAAFKLAQRFPAALLAPSEAAAYRGDELELPELAAHALARLPPLLMMGAYAIPVGIDHARLARCMTAAAYQRILEQLFADTEPMDYSGLPDRQGGRMAARAALDRLCARTERELKISF